MKEEIENKSEGLSVGDTIYMFDNSKEYSHNYKYEEKFVPMMIYSETRVSWKVGRIGWDKNLSTVIKKTLIENVYNYSNIHYFTEKQMHDKIWLVQYKNEIIKHFEGSNDISFLKEIHKLIRLTYGDK